MLHLNEVFAKLRAQQATATSDRDRRARQAEAVQRHLFPAQRDLIADPHRWKVALCPGRAGKTTTTGAYLLTVALRRPRANILYLSLTEEVARRYLWGELLEYDRKHGLGCTFRETEGAVLVPGGAIIYFGGAGNVDVIENYRGTPWDLVVIDESKSIAPRVMRRLLEDILPPRLRDRRGTVLVEGTPGDALIGPFWEISDKPATVIRQDGAERVATSRPYRKRDEVNWRGVHWQWSLHHWPLSENTKVHFEDCEPGCARAHIWEDSLEEKRRRNWADDHPSWLREALGEWAADGTGKCYAYEPKRNTWKPARTAANPLGLPQPHDWYFTMGVDFGTTDRFAVVTWAYAADYPNLLQVGEFAQAGLTIRRQAEILREKYAALGGYCVSMVGDPSKKSIMLELQEEYGIPIEPAEKAGKRAAVEMMKADQIEGRVRAFEGAEIIEEWSALVWDDKGEREVEGMPADCADAGLYGYRAARHRFATEAQPPIKPGTPEHDALLEEREIARAIARENAMADPEGDGDRIDNTGWFGEETY